MIKHRSIGIIALVMLGGLCHAQNQVSQKRLDAIWNAVDDRISQQTDTWFDDGDYPLVIHTLVLQTTYGPHNYEAWTNLGWMEENIEEWDTALATYVKYRQLNPKDHDRALPEAQYLFLRRQYAGIPALLEPVLKEHPHPNNFRILAHTYEKLHRYADAVRVWKMYVALAPNDDQAKRNLASAEKKLAAGGK